MSTIVNGSSSQFKSCVLIPEDESLKVINLEHMERKTLGRCLELGINDLSVSRKQVLIWPEASKEILYLKHIGTNPTFLNGEIVVKDEDYSVTNGSVISLAKDKFKFRVEFIQKQNMDEPSTPLRLVKKTKLSEEEVFQWVPTGKAILFCKYQIDDKIEKVLQKNEPFRLACFDMDSTIIKTASGHVHPRSELDWMFWDNSVVPSLRKLNEDGYIIVIFSNQASLKFNDRIAPFKSKIEKILEKIDIPMMVLISTMEDFHRKPAPGMWFHLKDVVLKGKDICLDKSFFVGDAAGRIAGWKPKKGKDFSNADRLFAKNINLRFSTPEAFFLKEKEGRYSPPKFDPSDYDRNADVEKICEPLPSIDLEVIVMVGLPASGKSTFVNEYIVPKGYVRVNRDILGTWKKCEELIKSSLRNRKKVVVDNTNVDVTSRKKIIDISNQFKVAIRCFVMDSSALRCLHNNQYRFVKKTDHPPVNTITIKTMNSKFVQPKIEEGFTHVIKIPFIPKFHNDSDRELYNYHLLMFK